MQVVIIIQHTVCMFSSSPGYTYNKNVANGLSSHNTHIQFQTADKLQNSSFTKRRGVHCAGTCFISMKIVGVSLEFFEFSSFVVQRKDQIQNVVVFHLPKPKLANHFSREPRTKQKSHAIINCSHEMPMRIRSFHSTSNTVRSYNPAGLYCTILTWYKFRHIHRNEIMGSFVRAPFQRTKHIGTVERIL